MSPRIPRLQSGGIITNYNCTSQCRHCLYASGPHRDKTFMGTEVMSKIIEALRRGGSRSVHIGGGEPLINPSGVAKTAVCLGDGGITVDYVETNSSWFTTQEKANTILETLRDAGVHTLLVSISPFHNEFIPLKKIQGVIDACRRTGMGIFPWVEGFLYDLGSFSPEEPHSLQEYEKRFGSGYLAEIPGRYWITMRGRALETYKPYMETVSLEKLVESNPGSCRELFDTSHFHMDLYGNYLPGLCAGLAVGVEDSAAIVGDGGEVQRKYPFLRILMTEGISGLIRKAQEEYVFKPEEGYVSKCDVCQSIRKFLVINSGVRTADLKPEEFYRAINGEVSSVPGGIDFPWIFK